MIMITMITTADLTLPQMNNMKNECEFDVIISGNVFTDESGFGGKSSGVDVDVEQLFLQRIGRARKL